MPKVKKKKRRKPQTALAKLNIRQRKFLKLYLQTGNASQSALDAGYAVRQQAFKMVSKDAIQSAFQQLLDQEGITDRKLVETLKDGLRATKTVGAALLLTQDGKLIKAEEQGAIEVDDHAVRHKFLETGLKLKGKVEKQQIDVKVAGEVKHTFEVVKYGELPKNELPAGRGKKHNTGS